MGFLNPVWNGAASVGSSLGASMNAAFTPNAQTGAASSLAGQVTATGLSMTGEALSGLGALGTGLYQAKVGDNNARILEANAKAALIAGSDEESRYRISAGQLKGSQKAALAANGIDVASPVAQDIARSSDAVANTDAAVIRYNAEREAYAGRIAASSAKANANISRALGVNALASGLFKAGSSFISGASSLSDKWSQFKMVGAQ